MLKLKHMRINRKQIRFSIFILGLLVMAVLFVALMQAKFSNVFASSEDASKEDSYITIYDSGNELVVKSSATTVREVLERAEIKIENEDIVEPGLDEAIDGSDFNINIYRSREVLVIDNHVKKYVRTAATEATEIAKAAGVTIKEADAVQLVKYNNILESGMATAYKVVHAKTVNINYSGKAVQKRTQAKTVGELLSQLKIERGAKTNWVSLPDEAKIADGMELSIYYQGKGNIVVEEEIPFAEQVTYDFSLDYGTRNITTPGINGKKTATYEVVMKDGKELSRTLISEIIAQEAVTQQVTVGMKVVLPPGSHQDWMAAAGISPSDFGYVNYIISHESGWRPNASNGKYHGLYQTSVGRLTNDCGPNWVNETICQIRSANNYAVGRYGSWANAYQHWTTKHWW